MVQILKKIYDVIVSKVGIYKSKVSDRSRGRPEGSLFNSYNTEV